LYCDSLKESYILVLRKRERERDVERKNVRTIESTREIFKDRQRERERKRDEYERQGG